MKKVSIIIPCYNEEKDLPICLGSLTKQSYKNFETIIVDDGSSDNTLDIAKKFRTKILKQDHQGPGKARNLGAKNARGEILVFVDADMHFDKDYLKNLVSPILADMEIIGTTHETEIATNTNNPWSSMWGKMRVSKETAKNQKIFRAIRKNKFLEMGGFDPHYGYADDQTFWFKYHLSSVVAEKTICYHKNPESIKSTYKQAKWIGASWRNRFAFFEIPVISHFCSVILFLMVPFLAVGKSLVDRRNRMSFRLRFYFVKFFGYSVGVFKSIFLGNNVK